MTFVVTALVALALPPLVGWFWVGVVRLFRVHPSFVASWISSAIGGVVASLADGGRAWLSGATASLLTALAILWWRRRKRKGTASLLGEKSRALIAALVARLREAARPPAGSETAEAVARMSRLKDRAIDFMLAQNRALVVDQLTAEITSAIRESSKRPGCHFHDCGCPDCLRHAHAQADLAVIQRAAIRHGGGQVPGEHCDDELCEGCRAYEETIRDAVARKIRGAW